MKVLFVIDTIQGSGAERSLVEIAQHLQNFTPVFVHIYKGDMLKPVLDNAGIKVYSLNIPGPRNFKMAAKKLAEIYEIEKPDLIHSTLFRADSVTRKLRSDFSIPLINSFVNNSYSELRFKSLSFSMNIKLRIVQLYDAFTSKKADFFISNSETIKISKAKSTGVDLKKVKVIYRGRDINKFRGDNQSDLQALKESLNLGDNKVLINVSRLIERKGQMDLINAMPGILKKHPKTILLIAGHGVFEEKLQQEIIKLKLEENIKLLGRRQDIPQLLAISNLFVFPTHFEGLPGALIEAMMAEKIIVCSNIPENLECISNETAITFERGNVEELITKIDFALKNESKLLNKGKLASKIALQKFDIEAIAKQYEDTYVEVIHNFLK